MKNEYFGIIIKTDNAAFEDKPAEVARILRVLAERIEDRGMLDPGNCFPLRDGNGNDVGSGIQYEIEGELVMGPARKETV